MLERFYSLSSISSTDLNHVQLLKSVLKECLSYGQFQEDGLLIYAKTQTHNTVCNQWLRQLANSLGLENWVVTTLSQNHCASFISAIHLVRQMGLHKPVLLVTGEKSFHRGFGELGIGVLGELSTAVLLNCPEFGFQWEILNTYVEHEPKDFMGIHSNTGRTSNHWSDFPDRLSEFLTRSFSRSSYSLESVDVFAPINFNIPAFKEALAKTGIQNRKLVEHSKSHGHLFCSDIPHNLWAVTDNDSPLCLGVAIGIGTTYSSILLRKRGTTASDKRA